MTDVKLDSNVPTEEIGALELSNGDDESSVLAQTLQNDDDGEKGRYLSSLLL